jgi:acetoin utilization protein AcuB
MKSFINPNIPVLKPSDSVDDALVLFNDYKLDLLPYIQDEVFSGYYSEDLLLNYDNDDLLNGIQALPGECVLEESDSLLEGIRKFMTAQLPLLPVCDEEHRFLGIVEKVRLIDELTTQMGLQNSGGLLEIHLKGRDYSLAEISRIVESESTKILSSFVHAEEDDDLILTLKLDKTQISTVVSALTRFGYDVISYHSSEPVTNIEKDRYEQLMRYLSI